MKIRGTFNILTATLMVAVATANAHAARLGWIAAQSSSGIPGTTSNPIVPAGMVLYTVAVQTTTQDGVGPLSISLTFTGVATKSPVQLASAAIGAIGNVQQLQDAFDNGKATLNASQFADTWFYSSTFNGGQVLDLDFNPATSNPALNYPGLSLNPLALAWNTAGGPNSITNTTGNAMSITGVWGNPYSADPTIAAASQVGPGIYPIAQILVPVNSIVPIASGATLGITTGNGNFYNVLGSFGGEGGAGAYLSGNPLAVFTDPHAIMFYPPEPSSIVLASVGVIGLLVARVRRRPKLTSNAR